MTSELTSSTNRWRAWITAILCGSALIFVAFIALWLRQVSTQVYTQGVNALAIRAVLRTDTDAVEAEKLAQRLRLDTPDLTIDVINEAMGRSLLALQEPWIAEMPDFEVTPLPPLLEFHHPQLLTNPVAISEFVEKLKSLPEVDFVAYNETAHDRLAKLADSTSSIQKHSVYWLLAAIIVAGLCAEIAFTAITPARSFLGLFLRQVVIWIISWVLAALSFRYWESGALATGEWNRLTSGTYFLVGACTFLTMLAGEAIFTLSAWLRR